MYKQTSRLFIVLISLICSRYCLCYYNHICRQLQHQYNTKQVSFNKNVNHDIKNNRKSNLIVNSIIPPYDQWSIYASIATSATIGIKLENTTIGRSLSGPVTAMLISAVLTNINVLPSDGSIFVSTLQSFVVKLATPLLLFGADIRKIIKETGVLFKAFLLGSFSTLIGSFISFLIFYKGFNTIGNTNDYWKLASALTAKNIGGGLNFMAVADTLQISSLAIAIGLAVDNIVGLLYFPFLAWLCNNYVTKKEKDEATSKNIEINNKISNPVDDLEALMISLSIGLSITAISEILSKLMSLPVLPISTLISVLLATIGSQIISKYVLSGELLGKLLLYLFFASIGISSGKLSSLFSTTGAISLLGYGLVMYIIHLFLIINGGKALSIPLPDILIASNANIGNAATASALCTSLNWKSRLLPGILVGTLGNVIGTFLGLWFGSIVLKFIV